MTLKRLPAMFGDRIVRVVSSCSLLLLLAVQAFSLDYRALSDDLAKAPNAEAAKRILANAEIPREDAQLFQTVSQIQDLKGPSLEVNVKRVRDMVDLRALVSPAGKGGKQAASAQASSIKSSPLYRDAGAGESHSWLGKAFERLGNLLKFNPPKAQISPVGGAGLNWIIYLMWFLLAAIIIGFIYLVARQVQFRANRKRRSRAVLEDDEPDRTLDEWLALSDSLAADGKYREAVRALYLSCLLKFDEKRVSRFIRGETNWEHLHRINESPKKPKDLDFLPPTQSFDRIWYGFHVRGLEDVREFRGWYEAISRSLSEVRA